MFKLKIRLLIQLIFLSTLFFYTVHGEDQCDSDTCTEDVDEEMHNVWKEQDSEEEGDHESISLVTKDFNELERRLVDSFFGHLKDWTVSSQSLSEYLPEDLFLAIMLTFSKFDKNDDGMLEYAEVQEDSDKIGNAFKDFPDDKMSLFQYFKIFKKLGGGTDMSELLQPFEKLDYMPPLAGKRILLGSVEMFKDSDEDENGKLDKEEFVKGMQKARGKREKSPIELSEEQSYSLFDMIDKDKDNYLTYTEFQATMPNRPENRKSPEDTINEMFTEADLDSDMEISEEEFKRHMVERASKTNIPAPSEAQMDLAFVQLDKDRNGALSVEEMQSLMTEVKSAQEKQLTSHFHEFDEDDDGVLSLEELKLVIKEMEKATGEKIDVKMFMTLLDADNDGTVSLQEMKNVLAKVTN